MQEIFLDTGERRLPGYLNYILKGGLENENDTI
jgi:hypothetical protein